MVFEMSIQDFDDQTQDHLFPHRNGGVDYREGSFISEEVKGYQEPGVYHSDSQVGTVFIRISVPELKLQKCLQFELDETVWQAKQRILGSFAKDLKDAVNYGLYCPPMNGRAGKFLDEERLLREYPLQGPIGFLEFKYKKRVYKMMHVNVRKLKQLHVKGNLRHFIDYVKTGNLEKVNKVTNKGLDPNFHDSGTGETPLCLAVSMCKPKCRELIISLAGGGAHLDFRNKKGMTALHVAVVAGNLEAIKTLLDLGVSPNLKDSRSLTPLYYTVSHCTSPSCVEMLLQERAFIGSQDEQGWFEIHHACRQGLVQHLEHLLFYGADMDVQNASGNTALHVCALHNRESCLRVLLFRGANKEILNYSNQSPYECAILAGNNAIAEILEGHKDDDVVQFRETPRFSTRRRDSVASAAMYALYRSRSDPRINHILISPSSSTQSFSHLHNSQTTTDSYSGSRGTDSPCSMSLSSSSSGPVLGVGEQGFWEGRVNNNEGMFPSNFVQEVKLRRKAGSLGDLVSASRHDMMLNRNTLAAIVPNFSEYAPRSVVLQKGPEGYGFVLRGAKSQTQATAELDFRPSAEFPALQYLDSVDPGSRADRAGLKTGDFILEINGENVVRASHDRVVQLIRQAGDTLALKVVTVKPLEKPEHWLQHHNGTMTLPNRGGARRQAPQPPQRDPQTSLSVGKAQGKQYAEGMAELEKTVQELNSSTEDQLDLALAEYEKQTVQSVVSSEQKTASIRSKHSAKRVSCVELDKIENPDSKSATSKGKAKDYMSPSEIRIQKYHHQKKNGNLERSSSTPSLVDKKEAVYATPTVPPTEQNDMGHRRSSSGAAVSHIYATPGERPRAPPPPPPANAMQSSPKRPAPAPPRPQSEIVSISTDRRKSASSITDSLPSSDKPSSEYESSFRPGISAQLSTEPKISTPSLQQVKLRSHNRNSSQVSLQSNDSGGSKRSEEKLGVTFADDKIQDHANQFLQKHPNAQLLVTADVHAKNKDKKVSEPEPDYDIDESDAKTNKVTVISVGGGIDTSKKFTVKSDIPSGGGGRIIPPPPSEPAPKPPSHKPPSPLPKPVKQDVEVRYSPLSDKKLDVDSNMKNFETSSVKSEEPLYSTVTKSSEPEPPKAPPAPPAPPPPPPAPPAPGVSAPVEKPKTPPPPVMEKKPKAAVQGIPSKDIMEAVLLRKTRIESEGMKISKGPNKEAPVKDGNDLRNRMLDNTHSAILAAVAKRRALLEEKDSDHSVAEDIENRLQKTKKLQSAKYFFSSETIQKKDGEKTNKIETKAENGPKEITPTIVKPATPTTVSSRTTKPPSPVPSKKTKPPSPAPVRKISPPTPGAKTLPSATKSTTAGVARTVEKAHAAPKPIYSSSAKPPSPKLKKAPSPVPVKSPVAETASDKPKETKSETLANTEKKERDENEDLLAKAEKARLDWLQKKSSTTSLKSPRDVARNPSKLNSPRRTASKAGANTEGTNAKKETSSPTKSTPKTNGMTLPLKTEPNNTSVQPKAKSPVQIQPAKSTEKSGITPMKTTKESDLLLKNKNIRDRIANFEKGKPVVNGKSDPDSKIPVHGVTVDSSVTDKSPALPPPPEFGDSVQLEIIPPPSGFNLSDNLESPTYNSAFHHSDSSSVSTLSTLSDDHVDAKMKHSYEDLIAPPPPGFGDNNEDSLPSVIPPPPDFGESKAGVKSNQTVNKPFLSKPLSSWQCLDVLDWLDSIQMVQYKKSFQQHCIDGKKLGGLQRNDYIQLGVTQVGHRMTMERAIKKASNIITGTHL
eukprot:XP_011439939.1 PREDICTED: SH3 and multiple ankyrin repeat domains protein 3 isoform X4 [Crassostrea gigas]